ncbi:RpiB/LacA/LacB family sugar-phosphate isomerase [Dickeya fangzhongdai]|uniref:RpiB/LacA/LacB family sugar-phosphate isomerase n=1 Tax=Dickeya fangzhongdai TaxID=1778540 RepID=UPI0004F75A2A|nr:RpiB/LacA/LacB family sugar-phosphate isomerase [Dickeya fangzhongdai]AIR68071.1 ribose 5-phosphate isomerase [Dickeya fangzhongdai]KGT97096.1 ribose 5-phosphate isomerase [Dickeya fangzhongdai]KHN52523.1 ribose 5-phosphate isomerase [Dickeya fangzhongdai]ULR33133.1 RpiB/LacA/LacB family sugar-phosphate isomerase [Dickeya fangzhongdai]WPD76192.1 RpiB/LacA/LacB family sugar-phosphate isomerase [Dickeya fangzhongdai]
MKPIAIGADDAAYELRSIITRYLDSLNIPWVDFSSDKNADNRYYPDVAHAVAMSIKAGQQDRGILMCGTGIGMSIVANKVPGIRAAQCHDTFSAERARKSNNAQIVTLGARVIGAELGKQIIHAWLNAEYEGGGSAPKVERIDYYQNQHIAE